jgi:alpha-tubulin suppressor-like RCC1 family protein
MFLESELKRLCKALPSKPGFASALFNASLLLIFAIGVHASAGTRVVAWGAGTIYKPSDNNDFGQSIVPANLTNAVQVAGGWRHSLALKADGTIQGWGDDTVGQINFPEGSDYTAVACGVEHSLALLTNGTVIAEGDNSYGEGDVPNGLTNVVAIAAGYYHSLALQSDGTVVAWGADAGVEPVGTNPNYGQADVPTNLANVVAISGGGYHSLALKSDGTLAEWGDQNSWGGQIPAGLSNVVAIAAGAEHNVALLASGMLVVWGTNIYGQTNLPPGLSNVVAIAAGGFHTLALKSNGTLVAWGAGIGSNPYVDYGQSTVPTGLTNLIQITAGFVNSLVLEGSAPLSLNTLLTANSLRTNGFSVSLPARNGRVYQLEYTSTLTNPAWTALPLQAGNGGTLLLNDPAVPALQRFYRVNRW